LEKRIINELQQHLKTIQILEKDTEWISILSRIAEICIHSLRSGGKILLCGNGGSAADAQHIAAELSGRYLKDRDPLFAEALHVNTSYLTSVANDYDYSEIYARALKGKGKPGDVLIGISTSGKSPNIIRALEAARELQISRIAFCGKTPNTLRDLAQYSLSVPSSDTPRIQEVHILFGHILCLLIEEAMFPDQ
jgi:D-sedoheptulose 7-phosphate isomerase